MYNRILVALENTPADEAVLPHVRRLVEAGDGAEVILVHVAEGFGARYQKSLNLADSQEIRDDRDYLDRRCAELAADGLNVRAVLELGDPAEKLVAVAEGESCDLIAMSTHRHGAIADMVLGSVAANVRHRTMIPVLLVPAR
ncbi:MAG: universal stress protein [Phycisphaeraceae bacterium]|nr:MAG: universal stress protein [Phycisphaeraceae bacterium]